MSVGGADFQVAGRIELGVVTRGLEAAAHSLQTVQTQAEATGRSLRSAGEGLAAAGKKAKGIGQSLTLGVTTPLVGLAGVAVNAASDLNESMSAVNTIFGKSAESVVKFSETSATALGISQQATLQAATQFGALFEATGSSAKQAAEFSTNLISASADLASFYNVAGGAQQVSEQFRAALTGEGDALKQYGIIINEASVQQELVRTGQDKLVGSALEAAKVQARYNLILKEMGAAQGDFARTSDGLANKTRIAKAQLQETAATIGQQLLPFVLKAATELSKLTVRFQTLSPRVKTAILVLGGIAAVAGPLLIAFGTIASAVASLLPVLGLLLGPIGLIILALVALGVAYKTNFLGFGDAVRAVGHVLGVFVKYLQAVNADGDLLNDWLSHLPGPLQAVAKLFGRLFLAIIKIGTGFKEMFAALFEGDFSTAFAKLRKVLAGVGDFLSAPAKAIGEFLKGLHTGFAPLDALIHRLGALWIDFGRLIQEVFQGDFKGALAVAERMVGHFISFGQAAFRLLWVGIVAAFDALRRVDWSPIIGAVVAAFSRAFDWLKGSGMELIGGLLAGAIEKLPDVLKWLGDLVVAFEPYLVDAHLWLLKTGYDLLTGLIQGLADRFPDLVHFLGEILRGLPAWLVDAATWLYPIGRDVVSGLWTGISSLGGWLYEMVKNFVISNVVNAATFGLKSSSPSKVMMDIGRDVARGLALGMQRGIPVVATATQQLTTTVAAVVPPPRLAPVTTARTVQAGGVTINVSGAGDPDLVAEKVFRSLDQAFNRLDLEVRR